jgi:Tfp pilus assembly protein PilF
MDAAGHHVVNLLFHLFNVVMLFYVLVRATGSVWPSAFVAAVFALHPLRVESVAWIAERKDVLSGTFWMLTLIAYVRYVTQPSRARYVLVAVALALGLLSKPMLVTLPFVLLLLDMWPLNRLQMGAPAGGKRKHPLGIQTHPFSRLVVEKIPLVAVALGFSLITLIAQRSQGAMTMMQSGELSFALRIQNAAVSYLGYISKTFYPSGLAVFYPHPGSSLPMWQAIGSFVVLVVVTALVIHAAKHGRRYPLTGWFWYVATLLPVIGLVQVGEQAMADRYTYLPLIGLLIVLAWGVGDVLARWPRLARATVVAAVVIVVALVGLTRAQVRHWRNSFTLYGHALAVTEDNWVANYNLGRAELLEGKIDEGILHLEATLQLVPESADARNNLGVALNAKGRYDEAVEQFREAVRINPDLARAHNNLGQALGLSNRLDEAIEHFQEALRIEPNYAKAHYNLCYARAEQGRFEEAIRHCDAALGIKPDYVEAARLKTSILRRLGY